ncbi:MAG TPA: hypothetical protein VEM57_00385 [Candidatus Binatus sp.]|nr:hypothetical protein [Candidatus Binatus sp.]
MRPAAGRLARLTAVLGVLFAALGLAADRFEEAMSAYAANVGTRDPAAESVPGVTLYVVPEGRMLLLTDVLVANHGQEVGPLYLADSHRTRCALQLLQLTQLPNNPFGFNTFVNVHATFSTGIPFGSGEPIVATLSGGTRGVDVTITGKLVAGPRRPGGIRFRGGGRDEAGDQAAPDADR